MIEPRPYAPLLAKLRQAGLRPTRQRLGLARLLFESGDRHVSAESLRAEAEARHLRVSLATVYNTLHQFTKAGLLREVAIEPGRSWFDTNVSDHHHFLMEKDGSLVDIPGESIALASLPSPPEGMRVARVDVIVRVAADSQAPSKAKNVD